MDTWHDGSISTGHANSSADMIGRLETLILLSRDFPLQAIKRQIGSALDILIHLGRLRDKSRRILEIDEVIFTNGDVRLNPLFSFEEDAGSKCIGQLVRTKNEMIKIEKLVRSGITGGVGD